MSQNPWILATLRWYLKWTIAKELVLVFLEASLTDIYVVTTILFQYSYSVMSLVIMYITCHN